MSLASVLWRMRAQIRAEVELGRACADCACTPAQKLGAHPHISVPRYLRGAFCTSRRLGKYQFCSGAETCDYGNSCAGAIVAHAPVRSASSSVIVR